MMKRIKLHAGSVASSGALAYGRHRLSTSKHESILRHYHITSPLNT